jgi:hypothetical protein
MSTKGESPATTGLYARKDEESPGTGPMIEGKSDSERGSWLFKPRVFFQFEFFSLGLWFCSEYTYFVVPTTKGITERPLLQLRKSRNLFTGL